MEMVNDALVLTIRSIIGDKVINMEGEEIGCIKDMLVDPLTGKIGYGVLVFKDGDTVKEFAVPYEAFVLHNEEKLFTLNVDKETLVKSNTTEEYQRKTYYIY